MKSFNGVCAAVALSVGAVAIAAPAAAETVNPGMERAASAARKDEAKAQLDLTRAKAESDRARAQDAEGQRIMNEAVAALDAQKSAYTEFSTRVGLSMTAKSAAAEASALKDISRLWGDAEESHAKGEKLVKDAQKALAKSEERRANAEARLMNAQIEIEMAGGAVVDGTAPAASSGGLLSNPPAVANETPAANTSDNTSGGPVDLLSNLPAAPAQDDDPN